MMKSIYESVNTRNALVFAAKAHEGQFRKYTNEPYITHSMAVAEMLLEHGVEDPEMHAAALLHDTVEDTAVTQEEIDEKFGTKVSLLVYGMTKLELPGVNRAKRKEIEALRLSKASRKVQVIKYADLLHNMKSIVEHDPKFAKVFVREARVLHNVMEKGAVVCESLRIELDHALWAYEGEE